MKRSLANERFERAVRGAFLPKALLFFCAGILLLTSAGVDAAVDPLVVDIVPFKQTKLDGATLLAKEGKEHIFKVIITEGYTPGERFEFIVDPGDGSPLLGNPDGTKSYIARHRFEPLGGTYTIDAVVTDLDTGQDAQVSREVRVVTETEFKGGGGGAPPPPPPPPPAGGFLQDLINNARGSVKVPPGVFNEDIVITERLKLIGTTDDNGNRLSTINGKIDVRFGGVVLADLNLDCTIPNSYCVDLENVNRVQILNCSLMVNGAGSSGIQIRNSCNYTQIAGCEIFGNNVEREFRADRSFAGIWHQAPESGFEWNWATRVQDSEVRYFVYGFKAEHGRINPQNSLFAENYIGCDYEWGVRGQLFRNTFAYNNFAGLRVAGTDLTDIHAKLQGTHNNDIFGVAWDMLDPADAPTYGVYADDETRSNGISDFNEFGFNNVFDNGVVDISVQVDLAGNRGTSPADVPGEGNQTSNNTITGGVLWE